MDSSHQLGRKLRSRYIDHLAFLPPTLHDPNAVYLRSTQYQRTFVSLQQVFRGLYPLDKRTIDHTLLSVTVLSPREETLMPPEDYCQRFQTLLDVFTKRAAVKCPLFRQKPRRLLVLRWVDPHANHLEGNNSPEMAVINKSLGRWMPDGCTIAVDSRPWKLHGILDTISSATAHAEMHKYLPTEFFDSDMRAAMERICAEEEFAGYAYSREFRELGVGKALAETVQRMLDIRSRTTNSARFCLLSCHDSTIAGILASLGAMAEPDWFWPPFAAFLAIELYRGQPDETTQREPWYARLCYMGKPLKLQIALPDGNHFPGDETLCKLVSSSCSSNIITEPRR
jgi:acid phosphatase